MIDLNGVVGRMYPFLRRVTGKNITLVTDLTTPLARVNADAGQVERLIMSLAVLARAAMPEGGQLTIATANVELDSQDIAQHCGASAGPHAVLAISDTGIGMDVIVQRRAIEQFFKTEELGRSTDQALATVYRIVKQSRGSLCVFSERGLGSTFKVYLPVDRRTHSTRCDAQPGRP
jgi:two-component system, cell cycle sensor histidine kinase and response regulator CckA